MWWNSNTYWGFHMIKSARSELAGEMLCESGYFVKKKMWYRVDYKPRKPNRSFSIRYLLLTILFHMCVMKCAIPTRNDFMTWNAFRITGLFMGICRSSEGFNAEFYVFIGVSLNKVLNKQSGCRWFGTSWCSCVVIVMINTKTLSSSSLSVRLYLKWIMISNRSTS